MYRKRAKTAFLAQVRVFGCGDMVLSGKGYFRAF
jgi:hypothetical protein